EFPVVDQRAVRRAVRRGGQGDEVVAERAPALGGERFGRLERRPVEVQEEVGEDLRRRETLPHDGRGEGQLGCPGAEQFAYPLLGPPSGRWEDTRRRRDMAPGELEHLPHEPRRCPVRQAYHTADAADP